MNWRAALLSGVLAAGLTLSLVPRAAADPPPWAGVWRHHHQEYDDDGDDDDYRYRDYGRYGDNGRVGRDDQCSPLLDRVDHDRSLIAQWEYTGRHQKVVRWAHKDIAEAQRNLYQCRSQARLGPYYGSNAGYDPYYQPRPSYDPYYGIDNGGSFDWKHDWPLLLGTVLNAQGGR